MTRRGLAAFAAAMVVAGATLSQSVSAEEIWPSRPIRLIVPFPAGSTTDLVARIVGQKLAERLGQQIVVDNRGGASGDIGMAAVARAVPNGYTIGLATISTQAIAPAMAQTLSYDPIKDFAPISMIGATPYVLTVYPGLAAKSVSGLIALAKTEPGQLTFASSGEATLAHLALAYFADMAGVKLTHVAYKGSSQSLLDIVAGRVDMQLGAIPTATPFIRSGQLQALAVTSANRTKLLLNVPTFAESGLPGYEATLWMALVAPAGTPQVVVARINRELNAILDSSEMQHVMAVQGMEPEPGTPQALAERISGDIAKWRKIIGKVGIHE